MNCPLHIPSQPPPFPNILQTPFFSTFANPSVDENNELIKASQKNVEFGFTAAQSDDPGTKGDNYWLQAEREYKFQSFPETEFIRYGLLQIDTPHV